MTLFAGALLRTIVFVMVTTDASFSQQLRGGVSVRGPAVTNWAKNQRIHVKKKKKVHQQKQQQYDTNVSLTLYVYLAFYRKIQTLYKRYNIV